MKQMFTTMLILGSLMTTSTYASETEEQTITLSKAELRSMLENMHDQLMAEKAAEMKKAQEARRKEMQNRFFFRDRRGDR